MQSKEGIEFLKRLKELEITDIDPADLKGVATFE